MPAAVPEIRDSERLGQPTSLPPSVTTHSVLSRSSSASPSHLASVGATIGIATNSLYGSGPVEVGSITVSNAVPVDISLAPFTSLDSSPILTSSS